MSIDYHGQLALMHALVRFAHIAAGSTLTTAEILPHVIKVLGCAAPTSSRSPHSATISRNSVPTALSPSSLAFGAINSSLRGGSICLVFLNFFERNMLRLRYTGLSSTGYQRVVDNLQQLVSAVGLQKVA